MVILYFDRCAYFIIPLKIWHMTWILRLTACLYKKVWPATFIHTKSLTCHILQRWETYFRWGPIFVTLRNMYSVAVHVYFKFGGEMNCLYRSTTSYWTYLKCLPVWNLVKMGQQRVQPLSCNVFFLTHLLIFNPFYNKSSPLTRTTLQPWHGW